ncbi:MAG: alanine dehydrogenase [Rhodospirillales bacterium]|jgi:alanine dehydrogenase
MKIGVPKEIKTHEYRVGLVPGSVRELTHHGHQLVVQTGAGLGAGHEDGAYLEAGAEILPHAPALFEAADLIVKVKEPQPSEIPHLRQGQTLFTYLHLAPDPRQADGLLLSGATAIAYETVTDAHGRLPLLAPMSEVAGRMAVQAGAHHLEKEQGGSGILLGGVPGVPPAQVVVLGGGVVGSNAARMAIGLGARVTLLDTNLARLAELEDHFGASLTTVYATLDAIERQVVDADLVIGAVLLPGAAAPRLISRDMLKKMRPGSVLVDVAIDQGGCAETSRPTTHADPTYVVEGVVHYCVANMPGAVARTSAQALNNATLPFVLALAGKGIKQALIDDPHLMAGLNIHQGKITHEAVARALSLPYVPPIEALAK